MAFKSITTSGDTFHKSTEEPQSQPHLHHMQHTTGKKLHSYSFGVAGWEASNRKQGMAGSLCHSTNGNCWVSTITHVCLCFTTYTRSPSYDTVTQHCILQMEKEQEHRMCIICHRIFTTPSKCRSRHDILCWQDQQFMDKTQNLDRTI